jgi:hypothetical protein
LAVAVAIARANARVCERPAHARLQRIRSPLTGASMAKRFGELPTPGGYDCGVAASALQKTIRRGLERDALFWATELDIAGYGNYVFGPRAANPLPWRGVRLASERGMGA